MKKYSIDESNSKLSTDVGIVPIEEEVTYRKCNIYAHKIALLEKKYLMGKNISLVESFLRSRSLDLSRRDLI